MEKIEIRYLGHACFWISWGEYLVVIDPYEDHFVPGLNPFRVAADGVLYSHSHEDHYGVKQVRIHERMKKPFAVETLECWHDDQQGALRGGNTIHILSGNGMKIAHLGDLGGDLSADQLQKLRDCDAVMVPVGGYYTIDAQQAKALMDQIQPKVVIPMHYRTEHFGFDEIGTLDEYTQLCKDVVYYQGNHIILKKDMPVQTAVLMYQKDDINTMESR